MKQKTPCRILKGNKFFTLSSLEKTWQLWCIAYHWKIQRVNSKFPHTLVSIVDDNEKEMNTILIMILKIFNKGLALIKKKVSMVLYTTIYPNQRQEGSIFSQTTKTIPNKFKDVSKITIKKGVTFLLVDGFINFSVY